MPSRAEGLSVPRGGDTLMVPVGPDAEVKSILDVDVGKLGELGVKHLCVDADGTMIGRGERDLSTEVVEHVTGMRNDGPIESLHVVTETVRRIGRLTQPLQPDGVVRPFFYRGRLITKTNPLFWRRVLDELDVDPETVGMVGDEYLRDIEIPNRLGMRTVLVTPRGPDYPHIRWRRRQDNRELARAKSVTRPSNNEGERATDREVLTEKQFELQTPREFRDDFVSSARGARRLGLEFMQFEVCPDTMPIFESLVQAKERGADDVRFHYDPVALWHIRAGKSRAWTYRDRIIFHRGDKTAVRDTLAEREQLLVDLEAHGITDPSNRKLGQDSRRSHNHVKLAIASSGEVGSDDSAWFGTMNLREEDFAVSNFMMKVTEPRSVAWLREVFDQTESGQPAHDQVFVVDRDETGNERTTFLLDAGNKGESVIRDKALDMADSLQEGDRFIFVSQWPPVKGYGSLIETLNAKASAGSDGAYLINPADRLHLSPALSQMFQKRVERMQRSNPNIHFTNLARQTHVKTLLIVRKDGRREALFGSSNMTDWTVDQWHNRELSMWTSDPEIVGQVAQFLQDIQTEA